jgi:glucokinase
MALILADVGGTNVRFACVATGKTTPEHVRRFQNDDYARFEDALDAYLAAYSIEAATALSIAVAGPVAGETARLTNRDWHFDTRSICHDFGLERTYLLNDLSALGYALDVLDEEGLREILPADGAPSPGSQRLVIGVGTGVNVSPVLTVGGRSVCLRAEAGLVSLPLRVARVMEAYLGGPAPWVRCSEDAVRGPGLSELHAAKTGAARSDARDIMAAAGTGDPQALASIEVFAEMLGELVHDLRLLYMPAGGIYLAGSVMRGVVDSPARGKLLATLQKQPTVKSTLPPVPISLITQDEAALLGCLSYARIMEEASD